MPVSVSADRQALSYVRCCVLQTYRRLAVLNAGSARATALQSSKLLQPRVAAALSSASKEGQKGRKHSGIVRQTDSPAGRAVVST